MSRRQHVIGILQQHLVLPLQVDCRVLLVRKPLVADRTLELVSYPALESHVSVEVVVPVVALPTLLTRERLLLMLLLSRATPG